MTCVRKTKSEHVQLGFDLSLKLQRAKIQTYLALTYVLFFKMERRNSTQRCPHRIHMLGARQLGFRNFLHAHGRMETIDNSFKDV